MKPKITSNILTADTPHGRIVFTHDIKRGLKRVYIRIEKGGKVVLRSAEISQSQAVRIITDKSEWITGKVKEVLSKPVEKPLEHIYLHGIKYDTHRIENHKMPAGKIKLTFENGRAVIEYNPLLMRDELIEAHLLKFYKKEAQKILIPMVDKWVGITGFKPLKISFRNSRTRWGSCSSRGNISLGISLAKVPLECAEYVVLHELCHIKHHNHSKAFWDEVARFMPDYQRNRNRLKDFRL